MIEATWKVNVSSGITNIELDDMDITNKEEWNALSKPEQELKINNYLKDNELYIAPEVTEFWFE
jgi:hypothetical protein